MEDRQLQIDDEKSTAANGVHTGDEIADALESDESTGQNLSQARVVGLDTTDETLVLTVQRFEEETATITLPRSKNGRLSAQARTLFHHFGLDVYDAAELQGATVPVRETVDGLALDLDIEPPQSNDRRPDGTVDTPSGALQSARQWTEQFPFWVGLLAGVTGLLLLVPLAIALVLSAVGVSTGGVVMAVVLQLLLAAVLVARSIAGSP